MTWLFQTAARFLGRETVLDNQVRGSGSNVEGWRIPFTTTGLRERYQSPEERLEQFRMTADDLVRSGFIPAYAVEELRGAAAKDRW